MENNPHTSDETPALRAVHSFEGRILIVESENDEIIPTATVRSYTEAVTNSEKLNYVVMAGAPRSITQLQKEYETIVFKWLESFK